jgi:hypothetical protein
MTSGAGIFFDGKTSERHDAAVTLGASSLHIEGRDGRLLAEWPYDEVDELSAPGAVLRLGRRGSAVQAHLAHAVRARLLENVVRADDVVRQYRVPRTFARHTGEVHHAIDVTHDGRYGSRVGDVARRNFLVGTGRREGFHIREA